MRGSWLVVTFVLTFACRFDTAGLDDTVGDDLDASIDDDSGPGDEPLLGTGRDGDLTVSAPTLVNVYAPITKGAGAGATTVSVTSDEGFGPGDLVMLHHASGLNPSAAPSGNQTMLDLGQLAIGEYQIVRLIAVAGAELELAEPTIAAFPGGLSQVVRIAELTSLIVEANGSIESAPWDGTSGGVIAVLVTGGVTLTGDIDASGAGFRGGATADNATFYSCAALDGPSSSGGGSVKGEGLVAGAGVTGRGNLGNGAGGGNCHNAGGGGGGSAGAGGDGGGTWSANEAYGGGGGAALTFDAGVRLVFGGGGGAGEDNNDGGNDRSDGGNGGGIVLVRARAFAGDGEIIASGVGGEASPWDGGGGGGAGGVILVTSVDGLDVTLTARGGRGGGSDDAGSGGGGGGGLVSVGGGSLSSTIRVEGGSGGSVANAGADGAMGRSELP